MAWSFSSDRPVYLQIADRIKKSVLSGEYLPGAQIPTVRQLALDAAVNPNTVQRAFLVLEDEGIILSRGTLGRFVTEEADIVETCRKQMAHQLINCFLADMKQLSVPKETIITMIEEDMQ